MGMMDRAAAARLLACLLAVLAAIAPALARYDPARATSAGWREQLQQAEVALTSGHPRAAQEAWEQAFRVAIQSRTPEALLAVGRAFLRIGEAGRDRSTAAARARRMMSGRSMALTMMIGMWQVAGKSASSSPTAKPSMSGSRRSRMIKSGHSVFARRRPSVPQ